MNRKERQIIEYLLTKNEVTTASVISGVVGCSIRSVKSYISGINDLYGQFISSSRSGYKIYNNELALSVLSEEDSIPQDNIDREIWVLNRLLIRQKHESVNSMAEKLFVSPQTIKKTLCNIKHRLAIYDLSLKTKNDLVWIVGTENDRRSMLIDLIYEEVPDSIVNNSRMQSLLPHVNIDSVRDIINRALSTYNYYIDDYSLMNVIIYIATIVEVKITKSEQKELEIANYARHFPAHILGIIQMIQKLVKEVFDVTLESGHLHDLALLMTTRDLNSDLKPNSYDKIESLIEKMNTAISHTFDLKVSLKGDVAIFSRHIENLLIRLENNIKFKNPQLDIIRASSPYIYEIAILASRIISKETGYYVPEDEIGFLAIYLGMMFAEQKSIETKIRAILICPKYMDSRNDLESKINSIFGDDLIIVSSLSNTNNILDKDFDFIISTQHIFSATSKPVRVISMSLTTEDKITINDEIVKQRLARIRNTFTEDLDKLFTSDFYYYKPDFENEKDALNFMADDLYRHNYVDNEFKASVFDRENICSSALGNIAIPHPLKTCSVKSVVSIAVLPNGVSWNNKNTVNLILMISICDDDRLLLQDILEFISEFIVDSSSLQSIMKAKTYPEFRSLITDFFTNKLGK